MTTNLTKGKLFIYLSCKLNTTFKFLILFMQMNCLCENCKQHIKLIKKSFSYVKLNKMVEKYSGTFNLC